GGLEPLDCPAPRRGPESGKGGGGSQAPGFRRERPLLSEEGGPSLGGGQGVEEGDAREPLILARGRGREGQPAPELPPAGGGDAVEVAAGPAPGSEHLQVDETRPPEPGEGRVD